MAAAQPLVDHLTLTTCGSFIMPHHDNKSSVKSHLFLDENKLKSVWKNYRIKIVKVDLSVVGPTRHHIFAVGSSQMLTGQVG